MSSIVFEDQHPDPGINPGRADVACFVGLVRLVGGVALTALPASISAWFEQQGWSQGPFARPLADQLSLLDMPVPIESFAGFTTLFDAGGSSLSVGTDYLAAAVRSFFAQGGKRCYVVRMGDPITPSGSPSNLLDTLVPLQIDAADDPRGWHGISHLGGLPDVSFVALPDLPVLCASGPPQISYLPSAAPTGPEAFVECSVADITAAEQPTYSALAPRLSLSNYAAWAKALRSVLQYVTTNAREVQVVAAMPLPLVVDAATSLGIQDGVASAATLAEDIHEVIAAALDEDADSPTSISTAFLQLGYPWLMTTGSSILLEQLEPPDGVLTGLLARNALTRGTFNSATKVPPAEVYDTWPELPTQDVKVSVTPLTWGDNSTKPLIERLSLFGSTPAGLRLLSDVTAYPGESYRSGPVNRLVSVIVRASRLLGEQIVFDNSGPRLWGRVEAMLTQLLTALWQLNALDGETASAAFAVNCDATTMTQNDLDNGRVIAVVSFTAASTIEVIRVTLALEPGGTTAESLSFELPGVA